MCYYSECLHGAHDAVDQGDFFDGDVLLVVFLVGRDKAQAAGCGAPADALDGAEAVGGDDAVDVAERQERDVVDALQGYDVAVIDFGLHRVARSVAPQRRLFVAGHADEEVGALTVG